MEIEHAETSAHIVSEASQYDFGDLNGKENPLRKLVVPKHLLQEFKMFENRLCQEMENMNHRHNADYERCMFCWLEHTITSPDKSERDLIGRFLLFSRAWYEMYFSTLEGGKCIDCDGSLPLGRDKSTG